MTESDEPVKLLPALIAAETISDPEARRAEVKRLRQADFERARRRNAETARAVVKALGGAVTLAQFDEAAGRDEYRFLPLYMGPLDFRLWRKTQAAAALHDAVAYGLVTQEDGRFYAVDALRAAVNNIYQQ